MATAFAFDDELISGSLPLHPCFTLLAIRHSRRQLKNESINCIITQTSITSMLSCRRRTLTGYICPISMNLDTFLPGKLKEATLSSRRLFISRQLSKWFEYLSMSDDPVDLNHQEDPPSPPSQVLMLIRERKSLICLILIWHCTTTVYFEYHILSKNIYTLFPICIVSRPSSQRLSHSASRRSHFHKLEHSWASSPTCNDKCWNKGLLMLAWRPSIQCSTRHMEFNAHA
jgi:hypothetical protein